jgi:hypothetical protein
MASDVESGSHNPNQHVLSSFLRFPYESRPVRVLRRWRPFLRPKSAQKIGVFFTAFILSSLIVCVIFLSPHGPSLRLSDWRGPSQASHLDPDPPVLADPSETLLLGPKLPPLLPEPTPVLEGPPPPSPTPSPSPVSDVLTLEQIRDIVAPTQGFFSRDYSLGLGWNNVCVDYLSMTHQLKIIFLTDALYHRGCSPPGRITESHLDFTFVRLRTRMRIQYVRDAFLTLHQCSHTFTSAAPFARTMHLWSTRVML